MSKKSKKKRHVPVYQPPRKVSSFFSPKPQWEDSVVSYLDWSGNKPKMFDIEGNLWYGLMEKLMELDWRDARIIEVVETHIPTGVCFIEDFEAGNYLKVVVQHEENGVITKYDMKVSYNIPHHIVEEPIIEDEFERNLKWSPEKETDWHWRNYEGRSSF